MVVPDSITPIEGWKSFDLIDGELRSPSYPLTWPVEKPAEAECQNMQFTYSWEVASGKPAPVEEDVSYFGTQGPTGPVSGSVIRLLSAYSSPPPMPKTLLPPGKYWRLEQGVVRHRAPLISCSCGIYVAKQPQATSGYGPIIGKVKGWGNIVKHSAGWRVQYAYPSELYAHSVEQALELAAYGVPVILKEDVTDPALRTLLAINENTGSPKQRMPVVLAWGIPIMMVVLTAIQGVLLYRHPGIPGAVALATTALLAGITIGMKVGVHMSSNA